MRNAVLPFVLALPLCAAAQQQPESRPAHPTPKQLRIQRLHDDLTETVAQLQKAHAFRGTVVFTSQNDLNQVAPLDKAFVGARDGTDRWFALDDWRVVQRRDRTAVRRGQQGGWREPLGDTPDVPLTPALLLPHFRTAELSPPGPTMHNDRPAMRVHATWAGKAAKKVLYATTVPSSQHEQLIEALASAASRGNDKVHVSATLLYDPATRRWIEASLRFAYLDGRPFAEHEERPEPPHGLRPLPGRVTLQAIWHLQTCKPEQAPKPELDDEAQRVLRPRKRR
ncbi:MAG: hypothetical protein ACE37K_05040 [Planctomycetota bacterium]